MAHDKVLTTALQQWTEWGKLCFRPNWPAVDAFIGAAEPRLREDPSKLRELLQRSAGYLKQDDPFLSDLGTQAG